MADETTPDWRGGDADANGIYPSQYLLGQRFIMPLPEGGKNAIAISRSQEIYVTSLYALLVNAIFAGWWVLMTIAIPRIIPQRFASQPSIATITGRDIHESLLASLALLKHCFSNVFSYVKRSWGHRRQRLEDRQQFKFPWIDFIIGLVSLFLAAGAFVGGVVAGTYLPKRFILANAAPANPYTVLFPHGSIIGDSYHPLYPAFRLIYSMMVVRTLGSLDIGTFRQSLKHHVKFRTTQDMTIGGHGQTGSSYGMEYSYSVSGYEMGLQHANDLNITIVGNCSFKYEWPIIEDSEAMIISLGPAHATNSTLIRITKIGGFKTSHGSQDPWYLSKADEAIAFQRPPLLCRERQYWSYRGWTGTIRDIKDNKAPIQLPEAILKVLEYYFGWSMDPGGYLLSPTYSFAHTIPRFMSLQSSRSHDTWALTTGWDKDEVGRPVYIHGTDLKAAEDMRRIVEGAYVAMKELFRLGTLSYSMWMDDHKIQVKDDSYNFLRLADGAALPGAGDFVIYTEGATALRLEALVAIPAVLVLSWIIVAISQWLLPKHRGSLREGEGACGESNSTSNKCGAHEGAD
ncbi:hypothetical protein BDZ91DRAFT_849932 [Kalaharituber pfeilii]|nr:hypothetical protein BDZ91DRAFT_849932 [Kalaharituber pfeilii]